MSRVLCLAQRMQLFGVHFWLGRQVASFPPEKAALPEAPSTNCSINPKQPDGELGPLGFGCFNPKAPNAAACTMSIVVEVGLLSGKTAALKAGLDEKVEELKFRAQTALGIRKGWLLDSAGSVLNAIAPIKDSGVQYGDSSTLHIYRIHACRTASTLPVIHGDGSGTVWE
eukprot:s1612_g6.t1